jgi:ABC-2 type transport system ATP-binding protein
MIDLQGVTKRYGARSVLTDLSFRVEAGAVTGFLGPNGSGKTTTARILLGLTRADEGAATINGRRYGEFKHPLREVGALLDPGGVHPGRTAVEHLRWLAASNRLPLGRAEEVLGMVGLDSAAGRKVGGFSLGMRQRLGIAAALIGDPPVLLLDEPVNGLDPEGIYWIRTFTQGLAAEGRTVFLSSHLMSEMALTATELVVIGRGRLIAAESLAEFVERSELTVRVRGPELDILECALADDAATVNRHGDMLDVSGVTIEQVGALASSLGVVLHELSPQRASLEDAFMNLTANVCEYVPERAA